jgi:hypothetical protein
MNLLVLGNVLTETKGFSGPHTDGGDGNIP